MQHMLPTRLMLARTGECHLQILKMTKDLERKLTRPGGWNQWSNSMCRPYNVPSTPHLSHDCHQCGKRDKQQVGRFEEVSGIRWGSRNITLIIRDPLISAHVCTVHCTPHVPNLIISDWNFLTDHLYLPIQKIWQSNVLSSPKISRRLLGRDGWSVSRGACGTGEYTPIQPAGQVTKVTEEESTLLVARQPSVCHQSTQLHQNTRRTDQPATNATMWFQPTNTHQWWLVIL